MCFLVTDSPFELLSSFFRVWVELVRGFSDEKKIIERDCLGSCVKDSILNVNNY